MRGPGCETVCPTHADDRQGLEKLEKHDDEVIHIFEDSLADRHPSLLYDVSDR